MASIHRHYGRWRVQIRKQGCSPISKTFPFKKDAQLWARETERAIDLGRYQSPKETTSTLGNVLQRYLAEVTPLKKGRDVERYRIRKILRHALSKVSVCRLRSSDIASYRDSRIVEASAGTVRKELHLLSHAVDVAMIEWGEPFPTNPVKSVRKPTEGAGRERRLEKNEEEALLQEARAGRNVWVQPLIVIAIETAMRRGELLNMRWEDVNLHSRVIHLRMTKNGSSRQVPLSPAALDTLNTMPRDLQGYVFPLSKDSVRSNWSRICHNSGIGDLRFHDLRHEATSRLFEKGLSVMEVASITGHKDLRMLHRYTHLKAEDLAVKLS